MFQVREKKTDLLYLFVISILLFAQTRALGQCVTPQVRYYATTQQTNPGFLTSVDNASSAADGNPATYSTLNRLIGGLGLGVVTQYLKFDNPAAPGTSLSAGTNVTVKLSLPSGLLSLLSGVEIQPFVNLHNSGGWQADAVGPAISGATLVGLLGGAGDQEITVTPTGSFDGVWVRLTGIAVGQSIKVYDAYIMQPAAANAACNTPIDVESGIRPITPLANIGSVLGTVQNPGNAIDADTNSYAEIDAVANVLNSVYHTTIFGSPTRRGDTVKMMIQNSGPGLLDLDLGSGFSVQLYNGSTPVGSPIIYSPTSLDLKLFPRATNKYELDISPASDAVYDRVEVSVGGVTTLGLTKGLLIYDVKRVIAKPVINNSPTPTISTICEGSTTTLKVTNPQDCTTYKWYDAASGGNLLYTGASYPLPNTLSAGTHTFYVEASRDGCTETSTRALSTVNVNPMPTVIPGISSACVGATSTTLNYAGGVNSPTKYSIVWDNTATNFTNVTNAALPSSTTGTIPITVPAGATAGTYTGSLTVKNDNQCSSNNIPISVKINPLPTSPVINISN